MDKNLILRKMEEINEEFQNLQRKKSMIQNELIKLEQEAYRLDGKYAAYDTLLQEINAIEKEAELNNAKIETNLENENENIIEEN